MLYPGSGKPIFEQLKEAILQMIEEGKYKPGDVLPSERELAGQYGISRVTVRQAINILVQDGIVTKKQGKGNFVSEKRMETSLSNLLGFVEEFVVQGLKCEILVTRQKYEEVPLEVAEAMRLQNGHEMFSLVRLIKVEGQVIGLDHIYIPKSIAYQFDQMNFDKIIVLRLLESQGYKLVSARQTITAEMPSPDNCELLEMDSNTPILVRCRVMYGEGEVPIAYSKTLYRGDRYHYTLILSRYYKDNLHMEHIF